MLTIKFAKRAAAAAVATCMALGALTIASAPAMADGHAAKAAKRAIDARRGYMQMIAMNLGPLGAMAKGEADYDAGVAGTNSANLALLANIDMDFLFPEGSGNDAFKGDTRTMPAVWTDAADWDEKTKAFSVAAQALADAAPNGLDALKGAIGGVGGSCGGCHKAFRAQDF